MSDIQPNMGKLLVKLEEETGKTAGGLFIPASAQTDGVKKGKVLAVGPTRMVDGAPTAILFNAGDRVLLDPLGGTKLKVNGEDLILLRVEDVLARLN